MIPVTAADLVDLATLATAAPWRIDVVYARADHPENMFGTAIYRTDARMWGHKEFVPIVLTAAQMCFEKRGWMFELKDCLRTVEAQEKMRKTDIVKANPQWLEEPGRLLSPPGKGGHPRGMAVDIILLDGQGRALDMGTPFDYLTTDRAHNPAARAYKNFSAEILDRRQFLEGCMVQAGEKHGRAIYPLPQEWWDFRFMPDDSNQYAPVSDADLPADMRMTD
jgi:D-alanyl-D-alanine dipeptidase